MKNCNEIMRGERAELSKKNPYYISKHRYYELKHFCRQYDEWKRALVRIDGWKAFPESTGAIVNATPSNPTEQMAMARAFYSSRVDLLEHCLGELEPAIAPYILRGVTEGHSYEALRIQGVPMLQGYLLQQLSQILLDPQPGAGMTRKIQAPLWTKVHENLIM